MTTDDILESIRAALAPDASAEARTRGADTCRAILGVLEPAAKPSPAATSMPPDFASLVGAVRHLAPEQLLDLAIARLRTALPTDTPIAPIAPVAPIKPIQFHLVPVPPKGPPR
jgi:hypothetical protein